eukprot:2209531-Rhodomonas_salina.1
MLLQRTSDASRAEASRIQTRMHSHVPQQHQAVSATVARPVCTDSDSETLDAKGRSASLSQNKTNLRSKLEAGAYRISLPGLLPLFLPVQTLGFRSSAPVVALLEPSATSVPGIARNKSRQHHDCQRTLPGCPRAVPPPLPCRVWTEQRRTRQSETSHAALQDGVSGARAWCRRCLEDIAPSPTPAACRRPAPQA